MLNNYSGDCTPGLVKVAIVVSGPSSEDARVIKLSSSLSKRYKVLVFGWNRTGYESTSRTLGNDVATYSFNWKTPYGRVYSRIVPTLLFSCWIFIALFKHMPRIVHVSSIDTAFVSYVYKSLTGNLLVFDWFDRWSLFLTKRKTISMLLKVLEEFFSCKADMFVTNSMKLFGTFVSAPSQYSIIMNCSYDKMKTIQIDRQQKNHFKIVYAGLVTAERGLELVAQAISKLRNVELTIAGRPSRYEYLKKLLEYPNSKYVGVIPYERALVLQATADAIVIPYNPQIPMNRIGMPNKLFDAMMLGVPVITTICEEIVEETECGIYVDFDLVSVRNAVVYLKNNPSIRRKLGVNGRKAFESKYNWDQMETKLLDLYESLLMKTANQTINNSL